MNFNPQEITARDLENPHFTAQDLQSIASVRPDLYDSVLRHPNCYPELASWINARRSASEAPAPQETPAAAGSQCCAAGGESSTEKAKGIANDFKNEFTASMKEKAPVAQKIKNPVILTGGLILSCVLSFIGMFFPILKVEIFGMQKSFGFFSNGIGSDGIFVLIFLVASVVLAVINFVKRGARQFVIGAGVTGIIGGLIVIYDIFSIGSHVGMVGVSLSFGAYILAVFALCTLVFSVLFLLTLRNGKA